MNPNPDRHRIEWLASLYLEAFESDDHATLEKLWLQAAQDQELQSAFEQVHSDLLEEHAAQDAEQSQAIIEKVLQKHMPSAESIPDPTRVITFSDAAKELFRHPPGQLSAADHAINALIQESSEALPPDLGLSGLMALGEVRFGSASREYWKALRKAALTVRMRSNSQMTDYELAARRAAKPGEQK